MTTSMRPYKPTFWQRVRPTWIVAVRADDGKKHFVSLRAWTFLGAWFKFHAMEFADVNDDLSMARCRVIGIPVRYSKWLRERSM